jgi:hypothetical protein
MPKITVAVSDEMFSALEKEARRLKLGNVQDVSRYIFAEYFKGKAEPDDKKSHS